MYKWFLAWRYLHTKLIAFFAIASVMLCVAMVLVVLSVMGGFLDTVRARSKGLNSEIVVEGGSLQGFPFYEEFGRYLQEKLPGVVRVTTPSIHSYGIFRVPETTWTKPTRVIGIRLAEYVQVNDFGKGLEYNKFFPGTTRLGPQKLPLAGFDETRRMRLPPDLEAANAVWREKEADPKVVTRFEDAPFEKAFYPECSAVVPGERVFAVAAGEPGYVDAEFDGVILGTDLLNYRRADGIYDRMLARGTQVALTLVPLSPAGNPTGEKPVSLPLRYADDSRTGIYEIDSFCVYLDFDVLQKRLAMDAQSKVDGGTTRPRANQVLVGLQAGIDVNDAKVRIKDVWREFRATLDAEMSDADGRALSFVDVLTWEDIQRGLIQAVEKEKVLVTFLFSLISVVAIVLVGCIFYMIVEKKTKDIGILKALGASGRGVASVFVLYAFAVGVVGAILGTLLGSVFVWNINAIQDFLAMLNPNLRVWSPDVYSFDRIPEVVKTLDAAVIGSAAVLSSVIGSLIPAWVAGRVWPVEALRYE